MKTVGRWPWKSESAKECVTTHLPNRLALKMDGAKAGSLCLTERVKTSDDTFSRVGGLGGYLEALGVSLGGISSSADLGSSSKYSSEILEDRSG